MVVKPSEFTSGTALEFAALAMEAGIPEGVINVVTGYGDPVGEAIATHPGIDFVTFTGSTATGKRIQQNAVAQTKRIALELGGKSANIVFADADMDAALDGTLFGVFHNTGQVCCAGSRLVIDEKIADRFLDRLTQSVAQIRIGDPFDAETDVGALIHEGQMRKVLGHIEAGREGGAAVLTGGEQLSGPAYDDGCFIAPTILDRVDREASVFTDEIFGPVLTVSRFSDTDEAIEIANDTALRPRQRPLDARTSTRRWASRGR